MFAESHGTIGAKPSEQNAAVHVIDGVLIGDTSAAANRLPGARRAPQPNNRVTARNPVNFQNQKPEQTRTNPNRIRPNSQSAATDRPLTPPPKSSPRPAPLSCADELIGVNHAR